MRPVIIALVLLGAVLLQAPVLVGLTILALCVVTALENVAVPVRASRSIRPPAPLIAVRLLRGPPH